ncbi:hypothetical protein IMY05_C4266000100 [Salix suchowensis]|nr:hypothetical protein IMY05_C4266000100 [Salix suchowensis]
MLPPRHAALLPSGKCSGPLTSKNTTQIRTIWCLMAVNSFTQHLIVSTVCTQRRTHQIPMRTRRRAREWSGRPANVCLSKIRCPTRCEQCSHNGFACNAFAFQPSAHRSASTPTCYANLEPCKRICTAHAIAKSWVIARTPSYSLGTAKATQCRHVCIAPFGLGSGNRFDSATQRTGAAVLIVYHKSSPPNPNPHPISRREFSRVRLIGHMGGAEVISYQTCQSFWVGGNVAAFLPHWNSSLLLRSRVKGRGKELKREGEEGRSRSPVSHFRVECAHATRPPMGRRRTRL